MSQLIYVLVKVSNSCWSYDMDEENDDIRVSKHPFL